MTKLAVVGYPALEDADRVWLESIRTQHASLIRAHFTLVFPAELAASTLIPHVAAVLVSSKPISFVVRRARAVSGAVGQVSQVFLLPSEGRGEIVALHDLLYEGVLRSRLREDMPFIPHITVAGCSTFEACESLADRLNKEQRAVRGLLRALEVVEVGAGGVRSVAVVALGQP